MLQRKLLAGEYQAQQVLKLLFTETSAHLGRAQHVLNGIHGAGEL